MSHNNEETDVVAYALLMSLAVTELMKNDSYLTRIVTDKMVEIAKAEEKKRGKFN